MSGEPLALVVREGRDYPGGEFTDYDVVDSRTGEAVATKACLESANEVAAFLNATYPTAEMAPAHDTLVHEIVCHRIAGEPPERLDTLVAGGEFVTACPDFVPWGPGWDHLYPEHESPGPGWYRAA